MGDAAISATIEVVLGTVISLASERIGLVRGFEKELESLSRYGKSIKCFLADADGKMLSPPVKDWLLQLEEEVLNAENVMDELRYEHLRRKVKYRNQHKAKACFFSFFSTIGFRCRLASKIRDINANFDRINGKANDLGLVYRHQIESALPAAADGATTSRQTDSVPVPNVVGRSEDESKIVEMLLSPSERALSLLPIIGMGGLGKTTLAKSVYNNPQIERHFNKRIWVCVAKEIKIMDLFKFILESSTGQKVEVDQRNAIVQKLREEIGEERYFIVLDDVWNHDQRLWEDFLDTLEGLNPTNGSWCLITTRLEPMAETVSRHLKMKFDPYFLEKLADDECWSILKGKVVAGEEVPKELQAIKVQILRRCSGLPLAAALIGGLLLRKGKEEWRSIVEGSLLKRDQNDTRQILKVSFDHLSPASVKKCFAYCSIFPQDMVFHKDSLIELWMAEGFLRPDRKNEGAMEEIGENYLRILLQSSLLEKAGDEHYIMHDLVHDFAKSVLNPESSKRECYRALNSSEEMTEDTINELPPSLRTLILPLEGGISDDILSKFKYLHVLILFGDDVKVLPASIGMLIHLRCLNISGCSIEILPESFYKLYNLQTLAIDVEMLNGLPERMSKLISLRHVHYYDEIGDFKMPLEIGRLSYLITLKHFNVGVEKGRQIEELGTLKNLKGSLVIGNLELVNGKEGAKLAKLFEKPYVSVLEFKWRRRDREVSTYGNDDDVLEGLQPNPNLQELKITDFMGYKFPNWFMNMSALKDLNLHNCRGCRELPTLGQLPSLRYLCCRGLDNIRSIGLSFYGITTDEEAEGRGGGGGSESTISGRFFPALEALVLSDLSNLVEWKDADEVRSAMGEAQVDLFPVLHTLYIDNCWQLTTAPSNFPSIEKLEITRGCHVLLVEKILSNIIALSSLAVVGGNEIIDDAQNISDLSLSKWRAGNLEEVGFDVRLSGCGELPREMLECLCNGSHPRHLNLSRLSELTSLRRIGFNKLEGSKSLEKLELRDCPNLRIDQDDVCEFQSLRELAVNKGCPNLVSIPLRFLTSLEDLTLGRDFCSSSEFDWSQLMSLSVLHKLHLFGLPHIESLPHQLQFLATLTELELQEFGMEDLPDWIGNITSLESLVLMDCPKLQYLPCTDAMSRLTNLRSLQVYDCPLLKERCIPNSGSEWFKVSRIPQLYFS